MEQIKENDATAYDRLCSLDPAQWARSQCPVRRFSFMTSNAAEVLNSRLLDARRLPICSMLEAFRHIVEQWFDTRRYKAVQRTHPLTEETVAKITPVIEKSESFTATYISDNIFKVHDGETNWTVDLSDSACSCREFDLDLIPCAHAAAAIRYLFCKY